MMVLDYMVYVSLYVCTIVCLWMCIFVRACVRWMCVCVWACVCVHGFKIQELEKRKASERLQSRHFEKKFYKNYPHPVSNFSFFICSFNCDYLIVYVMSPNPNQIRLDNFFRYSFIISYWTVISTLLKFCGGVTSIQICLWLILSIRLSACHLMADIPQ